MFDQHADLLGPDREIHRPANAGRKGRIVGRPIRQVAFLGNLEGAEQGEIEMAAADHQKRIGVVHVAATGDQGDRLLAGIDQIPVDLVVARRRSYPEDPVLAVQDNLSVGGDEVGNQGRQTDPEVHVGAVGKILRGSPGNLATFQWHLVRPPTRELRQDGRQRCRG